jgi:hypothetical protein
VRSQILDQLGASVHLTGVLRKGDLFAPEVGAGLRWRSLVLQAGYQTPISWSLEGRSIRLQALSIAAGWAPRLWQVGRLRLSGKLGAVGEHVILRRTDLERSEARDHTFWDLGAMLGISLEMKLGRGLSTGLVIDGHWFPAGREVRIPLGPAERLNSFSLRLGLRLAWGGVGDPAGHFL